MPGNVKSPEAVGEVASGKRTEANAAWWGFNETDVTSALQSAINSRVKKVVVPNMGKEWIVRPIFLANDQEIEFENGVVIKAKEGSSRGQAIVFSVLIVKKTSRCGVTAPRFRCGNPIIKTLLCIRRQNGV